MFAEQLVSEYKTDVNQEMIQKVINAGKPIIIFGCGGAGRVITSLLVEMGGNVECYCEGSRFWRENKTFLDKKVIQAEKVLDEFAEASVIVSATGMDVLDYIKTWRKDNSISVYGYVDRSQLYEMKADWVFEHKNELGITYSSLEDDLSRLTFLSYIGARANCVSRDKTIPLIDLWTSEQYFNDLYPESYFDEHILIDCGAWIGDTAEGFIKFLGSTSKNVLVRAFEMEEDNYNVLLTVAEKFKNIICYKNGVGSEKQTVYFEKKSDASVIVNYETEHSVDILPVDDVLKGGDNKASMVKMDLEGYERYALMGMKNLINDNLPMIAVCVYHRLDDLIEIPKLIADMTQEARQSKGINYKYYLRHHSHNAAELVFYAVPYKS